MMAVTRLAGSGNTGPVAATGSLPECTVTGWREGEGEGGGGVNQGGGKVGWVIKTPR
jgi:hypothetical protein